MREHGRERAEWVKDHVANPDDPWIPLRHKGRVVYRCFSLPSFLATAAAAIFLFFSFLDTRAEFASEIGQLLKETQQQKPINNASHSFDTRRERESVCMTKLESVVVTRVTLFRTFLNCVLKVPDLANNGCVFFFSFMSRERTRRPTNRTNWMLESKKVTFAFFLVPLPLFRLLSLFLYMSADQARMTTICHNRAVSFVCRWRLFIPRPEVEIVFSRKCKNNYAKTSKQNSARLMTAVLVIINEMPKEDSDKICDAGRLRKDVLRTLLASLPDCW